MKKVMMEGYIGDSPVKTNWYGEEVEITTYQGEHCDEYLVREVKSGRCSLLYKGIVKLSWKEVEGKIVDGFTLYENGKAMVRENWSSLWNKKERRCIENCKNGLELVVKGNGVVYRGDFDNMESMKREGRGMEFDEKNGRVLRCGVWKNDELFQVEKECESEDVMIEYAIEEGTSNLNVLNRHPVYEGGYVFDEEKREVLRHGEGCEIEGGVAGREGTWKKGELKESTELFDGWYVKREENDPLDWGFTTKRYLRVEINSWFEWKNVNKSVTELVISSNCCNDNIWGVFDVSRLKWLKSIEIGDDCFKNVNEMKLIGMNELNRIVIGKNCFCNGNGGEFLLKECRRMKSVTIGDNCFRNTSKVTFESEFFWK